MIPRWTCLAHRCTANPPLLPSDRTSRILLHLPAPVLVFVTLQCTCALPCLTPSGSTCHTHCTLHHMMPSLSFSVGHVGVLKVLHCMSHTTVFYAESPHTSLSSESLQLQVTLHQLSPSSSWIPFSETSHLSSFPEASISLPFLKLAISLPFLKPAISLPFLKPASLFLS